MQLGCTHTAAVGCANHQRAGVGSRAAKTDARRLRDQLVHADKEEACKLYLGNWPQTVDSHAHRAADNARFRERGIKDTLLTEFLLKVLSDPEDASILADVLSEQDDPLVSFHFQGERRIQRLDHRHLHLRLLLIRLALALYVAKEVCALFLPAWGQVGHRVVKEAIGSHGGHCFGYLDRFVDFFFNLFDDLPYSFLVKQVPPGEEFLETDNRVFCAPGLNFNRVTIARGVIGGSVRTDAIGECFYKRWPLPRARTFDRFLHHIVDRQDIIAIYELRWHAEARPASGECRGSALFMTRNTDGPAVVLHDQHHGGLVDPREIQRFVEITLGGCAIATDTHGYDWVASDFGGHGQANRVQHLRADHDLDRQTSQFAGPVLSREAAKRVGYGRYGNASDE